MRSRFVLGSMLIIMSLLTVGCGWDKCCTRPAPSGYTPCAAPQSSCCDPCGTSGAAPAPVPSYYPPPYTPR